MLTFPTDLLYFLVLVAASSLGLLAINRAVNAGNEAAKPLRTTLLVLFFVQLSLLTISLAINPGSAPLVELFPITFLVLNFIALLWITWACLSPSRAGWRKHIPLVLTLVASIIGGLSILYTATHPHDSTFWYTGLYLGWKVATLIVLVIGMVIILTRQRPFKLERFLVLFIASLGYLINIADWFVSVSPFSILFSQMLYYPLLTSLAWQTQLGTVLSSSAKPWPASPQMAEAFLALNLQTEQEQIRNALTHSLSIFLMSDLLGIVETSPQGGLQVSNAYDLIRESWLPAFELTAEQAPELSAHFEDGQPLISNIPQELPEEKAALVAALGYNASGNLLFYPFKEEGRRPRYGLLGLTPYTNRAWTEEDQARLAVIAEKVSQVLEQAISTEARAQSAEELRISLNQLQRQNTHLNADLEHHQTLLAELRQEYVQVKNNYTRETQLWANRQTALEGELATLNQKLAKQTAAFAEVEDLRQQKSTLEAALADATQRLDSLRQTLAGAQEMLGGSTLPPANASNFAELAGSDWLSSTQIETALQAELAESAQSLSARGVELQSQLGSLPALPRQTFIKLQQVLRCLLKNAAAVSPRGSKIHVDFVLTDEKDLPESLEVRVTDEGGGLSEDAQSHFLSLLANAEDSLPAEIGDAAALQQASALVQAAGGHWWIHTEPGRSTTYRVSLPMDVQTEHIQAEQKE